MPRCFNKQLSSSTEYLLNKQNWTKYERTALMFTPDSNSSEDVEKKDTDLPNKLLYNIDENPPLYSAIILGFQHYLTMFGSTVAVPFLLAPSLCITDKPLVMSEILNTIFFVSGIATLLQTTLGCRLPIVQGATFAFIGPTIAILELEPFKCPTGNKNTTVAHDWKNGMREIQGAIIIASTLQVLIGFSGLIGFLMRFIGPLTMATTISMVGFSLFQFVGDFAGKHWGFASLNVFLITLFSQVLHKKFKIFKLFPVTLSIGCCWSLSVIISTVKAWQDETKVISNHSVEVIGQAKWFRIPLPVQWGYPTFHIGSTVGMLGGVLVSIIESVGNYIACARLSGVHPPPSHAINRGIGCEGLSCILAGLWGSGNGTTSYSENIAAIGVTKVASRRVIQLGAILMIFFSVFGKFGALFILIPVPIIGGMFWILFGMILSVGLSSLQHVDLNSHRNLYVLGFSFFNGMVVPNWIKRNPHSIDTGIENLDMTLFIFLSSNMVIGGLTSILFDNVLPGTREERGITAWRNSETKNSRVYDIPFLQKYLNGKKWVMYIPFLPYQPKETHKDSRDRTHLLNIKKAFF